MLERLDPGADHWSKYSADHIARYLFACSYCDGKTVVDAGCGYGYGSGILSALGKAARIKSIDINADVVKDAALRWGEMNINFVIDDCETLATCLNDSADIVVSYENIEHLSKPNEFLKSAKRVLKKGGLLLCSTPDKLATPPFVDGKPVNDYHHNEWTLEEFNSMLINVFEKVKLYKQTRAYGSINRYDAVSRLNLATRKSLQLGAFSLAGIAYRFFKGRLNPFENCDANGLDSPSDYPITDHKVSHLFGVPWCHLAVCEK